MELDRKFKVGDLVRIVYTGSKNYNKLTQITRITPRGNFEVSTGEVFALTCSLELVKKEEQNQNTMKTKEQPTIVGKTKKAFHTFELEGRKVTIGVLGLQNEEWTLVGHSVCHPDDTFDEKLARKISLGRADSESRLGDHILCPELALDYGVLKSIAHRWERTIKEDPTIIGIYGTKR